MEFNSPHQAVEDAHIDKMENIHRCNSNESEINTNWMSVR